MRVSQKVKGILKTRLFLIYRNKTNITFQRNPLRLQSSGSSVSKDFLIPSEKKKVFWLRL
jgi:hypothetical protein